MRPSSLRVLRSTALALCCSIFAASVAYATDVPLAPAMAKQMLQARGVGQMVKVKETDGTTLRARIVSLGGESVVVQDGSKPAVTVPYDHITAVKGPGLSTGAKVTIGVVVGVVVAAAIVAAIFAATFKGPNITI